MLDTAKTVFTDDRLRDLEDVLWEWTNVVERTARAWRTENDVPWWYNERASLGMFAGAIWKSGGIALEEFVDEKLSTQVAEGNTGERWAGRVDLWFSLHREHFVVEAKQSWPAIGSRAQSAATEIDLQLKAAFRDAQSVNAGKAKRLAIVFASPSFPEGETPQRKQRLDHWISVVDGIECSAKASFLLHDCRHLTDEGYVYPGVAVFVKEVEP